MTKEKAAESRFWDDFVELLNHAGVPERALRWYVMRVEQYLKDQGNSALGDHCATQVTEYLAKAGRDGNLKGWQFGQIVHALQLLFTQYARVEWAVSFDWQYWLDSAQELQATHPTVARHNTPFKPTAAPPVETKLSDRKAFPYPQLTHDVIAEIRRRNYSIRTEQAYLAWVHRYAAFHDNRDPREMGPD